MSRPELVPPRYVRPERKHGNALSRHSERASWLFMRGSGVLLIALIFTHLFVNLFTGDGISAIDFAFVAGKWASPLWQWWDVAMLWLAMIHGTNGMRVIINDYAHRVVTKAILVWSLRLSFVVVVVLGTLVIFTFDPCPAGAAAADLPSFCEGN